MGSYVTSLNRQSRHWKDSSSKQCQGLDINNEMFQSSLNLSNHTFKIDAKILDLLRRFKAELLKVSVSIRDVVGPFNKPSKLCVYSNSIFSRHPYSHGELKATNHSQNRNIKNFKVVNEKYFYHFNNANVSCFPPLSYKCHISRNILVNPRSFDSSKRLTYWISWILKKNTWPGQELPASQKQTSYRENMKSQFNMAAMWRLCLQ